MNEFEIKGIKEFIKEEVAEQLEERLSELNPQEEAEEDLEEEEEEEEEEPEDEPGEQLTPKQQLNVKKVPQGQVSQKQMKRLQNPKPPKQAPTQAPEQEGQPDEW